MLLVLACLMWADTLQFKTTLTFEAVPEATEKFLQRPRGMVQGENDKYYLVDSGANCLFLWDSKGRFLKTIGGEGDGPGEFSFRSRNLAFIGFDGVHVIVCDGQKRQLYFFRDGSFVKTKNLPFGGRSRYFGVTQAGNLLYLGENYANKKPVTRLMILDEQLKAQKILLEFTDKNWFRNQDGGWTFRAYQPNPAVYSSSGYPYIIIGNTAKSEFEIYDLQGKQLQKVRFKIPLREITQRDRDDVSKAKWLRGSPKNHVIFPKYRPFYYKVCPLGSSQFLIYDQNPNDGFLQGYLVNVEGTVLGSFSFDFGIYGGVLSVGRQLVAFRADSEEDYKVQLWEIVPKSS